MVAGGMCPLYPLHLVVMYLLAMVPLWMVCFGAATAAASHISFDPAKVEMLMEGNTSVVNVEFSDFPIGEYEYRVFASDKDSGQVEVRPKHIVFRVDGGETSWKEALNLTGMGLGYTILRVSPVRVVKPLSSSSSTNGSASPDDISEAEDMVEGDLPVSVVRSNWRLDKIFAYSVATLVALTYVNMGCTLDLQVIKATLIRPIGPAIGLLCQYLIMPLAAFGLAMAFFTYPGIQLGLFLTGCSPGGGASNIWTFLLNGNINLSVTMTFVSSLLALGMVPLWVFLLAGYITQNPTPNTTLVVPYRNILTVLVSLIVPCGIGLLINRFLPKVANFLKRALKPWSIVLFIFIVAFGIYTNMYIWRLLTWELLGASALLPLAGFIGGALSSWATRRSWEDAVAITIETGIQNTGVAIFMLKFSLPEPSSDLSIVVPIVVATMTPVPLFAALILGRLRRCFAPAAPEKSPANGDASTDAENGRPLMNGQPAVAATGL